MFNTFDESQTAQLSREIHALIEVDCEAICKIQGAWHKDNTIGLIIEFMDLGSLDFLLADDFAHAQLPERVLAAMTYQILWGLCYLHYSKTMHRDIKPANILLSSDGEVKLSDFGISSMLNETSTMADTSVGTFRYMSPERLLGERYGPTADVWSLGLALMELQLRHYPFDRCHSSIDLIAELEVVHFHEFLATFCRRGSSCLGEKGKDEKEGEAIFSPLLADFLASMLATDPAARASSEALLHDSEWLATMLGCGEDGLENARGVVRAWVEDIGLGSGTSDGDLGASLGWREKERNGARGRKECIAEQTEDDTGDYDDDLFERPFREDEEKYNRK